MNLTAALVLLLAAQAQDALDPKSDALTVPYIRTESIAKYGYLELDYPKAFKTDNKGPLKTKPPIQEHSQTVDDGLREWISGGAEWMNENPQDREALPRMVKVLAQWGQHTRIVPFMDRYIRAGYKPTAMEIEVYVGGLVRLGRTAEAQQQYYAAAIKWGTLAVGIGGRLFADRFDTAWLIDRNFKDMIEAFQDGMARGIAPGDANQMEETLVGLLRKAGERKELAWFVPRMEKQWIWFSGDRVKTILDIFKSAGTEPPAALQAALDPLFGGAAVRPEALTHRAIVSLNAGQTAVALQQAERGVELAKPASPGQYFEALMIVNRVSRQRGDLEKALHNTEELERVAKEIKDQPEIGWAHYQKGQLMEKLGDYKVAAECYAQSYKIGTTLDYAELAVSSRRLLARSMIHLGMAPKVESELRNMATSALEQRIFIQVPPLYSDWGDCLLTLEFNEKALDAYKQALKPVKGVGAGFRTDLAVTLNCLRGMATALQRLKRFDEAEKAWDDYAAIARTTGTAVYDWNWQFGKAKCRWGKTDAQGAQEWIDRCLASVEAERASLTDFKSRQSLNENKYEAYELAMTLALARNDFALAFQIAERSRARSFLDGMGAASSNGQAPAAVDLPTFTKAIGDGCAVVYYQLPERLLAWVIANGKAEFVSLDVKPQDAEDYVVDLLQAIFLQSVELQDKIKSARPKKDPLVSSKLLWKLVWEPLASKLPAKKRLCIIPHGALHYVPFQALTDGTTFLIEDREVYYAPSASGLIEVERRRGTPSTSTLIFDPILSDDPKSPFWKTESAGLRAQYPQAKAVLKKDATLAAFREQAKDAGLIHISSHGYYNPWIPVNSGLVFAAPDPKDGLLTAGEIYGMRLDKTELVVMSACVSSVGDFGTGDEVTGLTRAFQVAGVPNVIGSLWPVENEGTIELMGLFHKALAETRNPAVALRRAQSEMISKKQPMVRWAAFQLTGLPGDLSAIIPASQK